MIKINDYFEIDKDSFCWKLHEWRIGVNKDGEETKNRRTTYHNSLIGVYNSIIDNMAGEACRQAGNIIAAIAQAKADFFKAISCASMKTEIPENAYHKEISEFIQNRAKKRRRRSS